jgi:hypothetical protein
MKQKREFNTPNDTPATRKKRLQQRLREINDQNDREMSALMKSIERVKSAFHSKKIAKSSRVRNSAAQRTRAKEL